MNNVDERQDDGPDRNPLVNRQLAWLDGARPYWWGLDPKTRALDMKRLCDDVDRELWIRSIAPGKEIVCGHKDLDWIASVCQQWAFEEGYKEELGVAP